ncbi:Basigin 5A11 antigen [Takifugu flavidus]|uniref:Basigin 5A11 antigen n=1 Tax=Takifugu flavidus TaxID=433684 RepID=A0A5C6MR24_9TELE|nr:Basigin 5A11 antigen [Takifugu flavidus]
MKLLWAVCALLLSCWRASASTAGFIKCPLSQMRLVGDSAELHCEVIGAPIPEVQWWFVEGEEPNETFTQLFDGAGDGRVQINATYIAHAASSIHIASLTLNDSGMYECRASNDPDRNELRKTPKIKWIRSQANIVVMEIPNISTDPPMVTNQTSATLTCNLTDPNLPIKGSHWLFNGKTVENSESTSSDSFTRLQVSLLTSADAGLWFLLSVFLSRSAASVGPTAAGASRQPLLLRARDGPADSLRGQSGVHGAAAQNKRGIVIIKYGNAALFSPPGSRAGTSLDKITYSSSGKYECVFETDPVVKEVIEVKSLPHVAAYKHSEHGNEKDKAVLVCVSHGYPLPTDWTWFTKEDNDVRSPIINGTSNKYEIKSTPNRTSLTINDLNIESDAGDYVCSGMNEIGTATNTIHLRVRSRWAALWPFLGIVAEVIILVTIIFIYEKRRKPDEINDEMQQAGMCQFMVVMMSSFTAGGDDDSGAAPLKSNSNANHKDKNVRHRNSN